jgi:phenylalanine-4-hydroxylase
MTPTERTIEALPSHLRRWVVVQDYAAYTARDQQTWRTILGRLVAELPARAHPSYLAGLASTGLGVERIPRLDEMNEKLARLGWGAVAVRGFIPPAVFTELQSRRVLAIAADIRRPEHLEYTPAPDIVHESAGHAPFLADARYAEYLQRCGEVGWRAIAAAEDEAVFEAVRHLSVVKEDAQATPEQVALAEARLQAALASVPFASEGTRASRLYWWTAEYGLVGKLGAPKIYGAGLLSSVGEATRCLGREVRKVALDASCAEVAFDITRMQPQLFVAADFEALFTVLESFAGTLSYRRGGDHGLAEALRSRTVVQLALPGGLALSGRVAELFPAGAAVAPGLSTALVRLDGPVLRSRHGRAEGGWFDGPGLMAFGAAAPLAPGRFQRTLETGLVLSGFHVGGGEVLQLSATWRGRPLALPRWAVLAVAEQLPSVAGGPADPEAAWEAGHPPGLQVTGVAATS